MGSYPAGFHLMAPTGSAVAHVRACHPNGQLTRLQDDFLEACKLELEHRLFYSHGRSPPWTCFSTTTAPAHTDYFLRTASDRDPRVLGPHEGCRAPALPRMPGGETRGSEGVTPITRAVGFAAWTATGSAAAPVLPSVASPAV